MSGDDRRKSRVSRASSLAADRAGQGHHRRSRDRRAIPFKDSNIWRVVRRSSNHQLHQRADECTKGGFACTNGRAFCTNCVSMTDAIGQACDAPSIALRNAAAAATAKPGRWPFKLATRDFSEPIRLRLTGTRLVRAARHLDQLVVAGPLVADDPVDIDDMAAVDADEADRCPAAIRRRRWRAGKTACRCRRRCRCSARWRGWRPRPRRRENACRRRARSAGGGRSAAAALRRRRAARSRRGRVPGSRRSTAAGTVAGAAGISTAVRRRAAASATASGFRSRAGRSGSEQQEEYAGNAERHDRDDDGEQVGRKRRRAGRRGHKRVQRDAAPWPCSACRKWRYRRRAADRISGGRPPRPVASQSASPDAAMAIAMLAAT